METKRITPAFADKALAGGCTVASIECTLNNIEEIFTECNEELAAMEMAEIGYSFQADEISRVAENMVKLQIYVGSAHPQVYDELDFPLYKDFKNHATETLSQIVLSDLSTDNTFGMEEHYKVSGRGETYTVKRVKSKITMEDFLGLKEISEEDGIPMLEHVETIGEFATLFRLDYDTMKMEDKDINACIEAYMTAGEYDHKAYHPVKDFLSGLLDMTIIKPLVECVTGKDLITGERLTETEKNWKLIGACIDLFTFGQGALAIKGAGLAGKQALKTIGRTMIVDMLSNTAGYTMAYECDELGMPMAVTWMLSVFTGCTVSAAAGKYIIKDADGLVKEIAPEDVDDFLKELEMKTGGTVEVESIPEVEQVLGGGGNSRYINGQRTSRYKQLTDDEISQLLEDIEALEADPSIFRFNEGNQTGFLDSEGIINVRGDVLPDLSSTHPRDLMSSRAVLAHEYYGHKHFDDVFGTRNPLPGSWNDEFRASYSAAINAPNLSDMDRMYLMLDALERAKEAGVNIKITDEIRRILYGY